jgi:hypothetical protein
MGVVRPRTDGPSEGSCHWTQIACPLPSGAEQLTPLDPPPTLSNHRAPQISQLCFETDVEPYAKARDAAVRQLAVAAGVAVSEHTSHTLYVSARARARAALGPLRGGTARPVFPASSDLLLLPSPPPNPTAHPPTPSRPPQEPEALIAANGGKPPLTMQSFTKLVDRVGDPAAPAAAPPAALPAPGAGAAGAEEGRTAVPSLQELGFTEAPTTPFKVRRTYAFCQPVLPGFSPRARRTAAPCSQHCLHTTTTIKPDRRAARPRPCGASRRPWPTPSGSAGLKSRPPTRRRLRSPPPRSSARTSSLAASAPGGARGGAVFGHCHGLLQPRLGHASCFTHHHHHHPPRLFHQRLLKAYRAAKGAHSKPPVSLRGQLLWREFFYTVSPACQPPRPRHPHP